MDEGATLSPSSSFSSCSSTRNYKYDEQTLYTSCSGRQRTNERTVRMVEHEWPTSFHYVALYSNLNSKSASFRPHVPFEKFIVEAWNHTSNGRRMDGWVGGWQMSCYAGQHKHSHLIILFTKSPVNCKSTVNWCNWWMEKRTSMPAVGVVVILFMQFNCH